MWASGEHGARGNGGGGREHSRRGNGMSKGQEARYRGLCKVNHGSRDKYTKMHDGDRIRNVGWFRKHYLSDGRVETPSGKLEVGRPEPQ